MRPRRLVVCFGTATSIGKTWVGASVLGMARAAGLRVAARKPTQSFDPCDASPTDAEVLATETGEQPSDVCPPAWSWAAPLAPPMAAAALGEAAPDFVEIVEWIDASWPQPTADVGWVETVGGPRSPLAPDGDGIDLAVSLRPDRAVLVADADLGTINAVRLSLDALARIRTPDGAQTPCTVFLNRYDDADALHVANRRWLAARCGHDLHVTTEAVAELLNSK